MAVALEVPDWTLKFPNSSTDSWNLKSVGKRLEALERKYDTQFKVVFDAIRELMTPKTPRSRPIGFVRPKEP